MALKIDQRLSGDVIILGVQGRMTHGEEKNPLREAIRDLLGTGHKKILLNMEGVSHIDSAGLGALASAYSSVLSRGGVLKLVGLQRRARSLLEVTKLLTVFDVAENEDEALHGDWSGRRAT